MEKSDFYKNELYQMQINYKNNPLENLKLSCPEWLNSNDPMYRIYEEKNILLQQGEITYAGIVQANKLLFRRFPPYNCPAEIVYSTGKYFDELPDNLYTISSHIYNFKDQPEKNIPTQWREIARVITDELDRTDFTFCWDIKGQSTEYRMIPTMIHRKLLPKGKLCGNLLPILTLPECKQVLILPKQYWTKNFTKAWVDGFV